ncbi:pyridoxamine 5'-phosphate oxidase family protein [Nocardioides sp. CPCC 206347]|uniref:pyridoxamine 5'-phosphate oxidase family protein n=1 Tax=Nocardioides sp. CPCC 206347 TaxID=3406463 RepID=UPI003B42AA71
MSTITELTASECEELLRAGVFGRLVLRDGPRGAEILPVNYVTVGDAILVRTATGSLIDQYGNGATLLFEVDQVDYERWHGWSVVARGQGELVSDDERSESERHTPGPPRWVRRDDARWLRLRWDELSGRRIGAAQDRVAGMPVRRTW